MSENDKVRVAIIGVGNCAGPWYWRFPNSPFFLFYEISPGTFHGL